LLLVPTGDHLEEEVGVAGVVGEIADLVHDQETRARAVVAEAAVEAAGGVLGGEVEEELAGRDEEDGVPGEHGLVADVLRDHGLAEALVGDEDDVAGLGEEVETEGRLDGVAIEAFRPRPVEVRHRLEAAEAGPGEAALEPATGAVLLLGGGQMLEELGRAPAGLG